MVLEIKSEVGLEAISLPILTEATEVEIALC